MLVLLAALPALILLTLLQVLLLELLPQLVQGLLQPFLLEPQLGLELAVPLVLLLSSLLGILPLTFRQLLPSYPPVPIPALLLRPVSALLA